MKKNKKIIAQFKTCPFQFKKKRTNEQRFEFIFTSSNCQIVWKKPNSIKAWWAVSAFSIVTNLFERYEQRPNLNQMRHFRYRSHKRCGFFSSFFIIFLENSDSWQCHELHIDAHTHGVRNGERDKAKKIDHRTSMHSNYSCLLLYVVESNWHDAIQSLLNDLFKITLNLDFLAQKKTPK